MTSPRDDHGALTPMTFDQFFDSDFAQRATVGDLAVILREVDRCGGPEQFKALHMNLTAFDPPSLEPCPRPFCDGAARLLDDEGFYWIECSACRHRLSARRDPSRAELAALVDAWNAPRPPAAEALPAFLRAQAERAMGIERLNLLDAAELIERQAVALVQRAAG